MINSYEIIVLDGSFPLTNTLASEPSSGSFSRVLYNSVAAVLRNSEVHPYSFYEYPRVNAVSNGGWEMRVVDY